MASVTKSSKDIPAIVLDRLRGLRRKLSGWILVDGLGRLAVALVVIALIDMGLDRLFKMDFAQRTIMLFIMASIALAIIYWRLIRPFDRRPNDDALILEVENKNRDLNESLISSVQLSREKDLQGKGMSASLTEATIKHGLAEAERIDFGTALNQRINTRNWLVLAVGLLGLGTLAFGVVSCSFLETWFNRNILLGDAQWPQNTYLQVVGAPNNQLVLDRGIDHIQKVMVEERSRDQDVDVFIEYDFGSRRTTQKMNLTGKENGLEHQILFSNVSTEFRFRARGGDAITPWVDVTLVEPIDVRELPMTVQYPDYVGRTKPLEGSGPHSILEGSKLTIGVTANMPVATAALRLDDGTQWTLNPQSDTEFQITLPDDVPGKTELRGGKYLVELTDAAGRKNLRPVSIDISIAKDGIPKVMATMAGISGLVVPRARIPLSYKVTDRYGITKTLIDYSWSDGNTNNEKNRGQANARDVAAKDIVQSGPNRDLEYSAKELFELESLKVPAGVVLRFTQNAVDNNPTGEGIGVSREFLLRVVTEDELRADLLRREMEQRKAFEQIKNNQIQLLTDLRALAAASSDNVNTDERQRLLLEFQNRQSNIGTNMFRISERFEDFLQEAENNRLDESEEKLKDDISDQTEMVVSIKTRYKDKIIKPISELEESEVYLAGRSIEEARRKMDTPQEFSRVLRETADLQEGIVKKMEQILAAMEDSQTYQEIVNLVISLKKLEQDILNGIKEKRDSQGGGDIFDDN